MTKFTYGFVWRTRGRDTGTHQADNHSIVRLVEAPVVVTRNLQKHLVCNESNWEVAA